jgi:hypothetical protein
MTIRAKFTLHSITQHAGGSNKTFKFFTVSNNETPENERFTKYTPSGELTLMVDNPPAEEQLKLGESYYLDFSPAPK